MATLYCLLFNTPVFLNNFKHYDTSLIGNIVESCKDFILVYSFLFIMFFGLTIHRKVFIVSTFALFTSGAVASYNLFFYYNVPSKENVRYFFSIDPSKIAQYLSVRLIIWIIFSIFVAIYTMRHFKVETTSLFFSRLLSALCLLFTLNCITVPPYKLLKTYFPISYLSNIYQHFSKQVPVKSSRNDCNYSAILFDPRTAS